MSSKLKMSPKVAPAVVLLVLSSCLSASLAYKDVIFVHGILAKAEEFTYFGKLIQQYHPGTRIHAPDLYDGLESVGPLWPQVKSFADQLKPILTNTSSEGTILISFSQGGMISRGLLSVVKHNVDTWISLSGPLAGQFGDTDFLKFLFPTYIKDNLYRIFYTPEGQDISVGNYWNDPHHGELYRNYSAYLGVLNNETEVVDPRNQEFRANFMRLKNLVLIGGPDDGVITPWQSSHFGSYDKDEVVLPMTESWWYKTDAFGLKTLNEAGSVHMYTQRNVTHTFWHQEKWIFDKYILPWLM